MTNFVDEIQKIINSEIRLIGLGELKHGENELVFMQLGKWGKGLGGIFLEVPVDFQNSINEYLKTRIFDNRYRALLRGALAEGKSLEKTHSLILDFAIDNNLPVVCVDSSKTKTLDYINKSKYNSSYTLGESRDEDMYLNIWSTLLAKEGKWVLVAGAAHLDYKYSLYDGRPSLGRRLRHRLKRKLFTILLLRRPNVEATSFYLSGELSKDIKTPIPGRLEESFDAVVVHP